MHQPPTDTSSPPRGIKRANDGTPVKPPARIKPLDQNVVNKIAAGEIIVAPVHALKELIENAVDAGSTQLEILIKDGGLKLLQISDNGCGIHKDDLPILCERFTTSKLKAFEDLTSISTYGFRGEALASISHIAHLTVTTRTQESTCAWKAQYSDGKLMVPTAREQNPKPAAGRFGTQITVEDLFYNIPNRRKSFRVPSEEYNKILDLVGRYAIHRANVSFSCKKHGEPGVGLSIPVNTNTLDRIRQIYGSPVANELVELKIDNNKWGFSATGHISNANYHVKKTTFVLFINHRAVESNALKKAMEQMYSTFLPKGGHPFIYLSLEIEPHRVDVNVHPTKREVNFLHQDEIIETLCTESRTTLGNIDTSRNFKTQTLLPNVRLQTSTNSRTTPYRQPQLPTAYSTPYLGTGKKPARADNDLIRTDSRARKITTMLRTFSTADSMDESYIDMQYEKRDKQYTNCQLDSIKELKAAVRSEMHNDLTDIFATHTFVGIVDTHRRIVALQSGTKLYLVDYALVCSEYFYQVGLTDFGNFGSIQFHTPLPLRTLLELGASHERSAAITTTTSTTPAGHPSPQPNWDEVTTLVAARLIERRAMLSECFALDISADGHLLALPLLVKGYLPPLGKLPRFLLRLGPFVRWDTEKECFESFLRQLALFYAPEALPMPSGPGAAKHRPPLPGDVMDVDEEGGEEAKDDGSGNGDNTNTNTNTNGDNDADANHAEDAHVAARRRHIERALEHTLFPAFRARIVGTKALLQGVTEVANLKGLYRVFERC